MPAMDRSKRPLAGHRRRLTLLLAATVLLSPAMAGASTAADPPGTAPRHRQADRAAGPGRRAGALHRRGQDREVVPPQDRITRSAWFVREHDEVPASVWRSAAVGKPSNCAACHTRAADGRFGEREIRLPL
jgi:hypothetical protein